jgi:putative ABC transport system permease protein
MDLWARIKDRWTSTRTQKERDLEREILSHLELEAEDSGRDAAQRAFGSTALTKENVRATWGWTRAEQIAQDIRYGLRQIRRNPTFSAIAIATLALGIGVNTAMFSAVDAVLIRPLPYHDADRLVMIWDNDTSRTGTSKFFTTPPEWNEWRRQNTVFTDIAASENADAALSNDGEPEELPAREVTGNFWTVLGVRPLLGRVFTEDEDVRGVRVVVISYGLWQRRFGGAPGVVGRTITLNDNAYEVIGVMPRGFYFMPARNIDVWMPASYAPGMFRNWGWHALHTVARLKPGVTPAQAQEAMAALSLRITTEHLGQPRSVVVAPLREELAGKTSTSLLVLLGASITVLLIACVNLANLLMARGAVRRPEVSVRAALGAGRARLFTQFLIESLVLAGLGAIAGLVLAFPLMRFLETLVPETMAAVRLTLDWRVLTFSTVVALAVGLTFGLAPAFGATRPRLHTALRDGSRGSTGRRSHYLQHSLIVVETALAVVLLTTGALLLQTFQHFNHLNLGIRSERLLTFETPLFRYRDFERRVAYVDAQLDKIRAIPGVVGAAAISRIPLTVTDQATFYLLAGQAPDAARDQVALTRVITRDYFSTVGAQLREGRFFAASDRRSPSPAAIVNESFARRNYPGRSPVGERFKFGALGDKGYWYTIVGVVAEIRDRGVTEEPLPTVYRVHEQADQNPNSPSGIVVRTSVEPRSIVPAVRNAIWSIDRNQPITRVQTVQDIVDRQLAVPSQNMVLSSAFACLALLLASIGLYGVLSYAVTQRTNEIGVRMALGATARDIMLSFGRRGLALTCAGLAIGSVMAAIAARMMATLFYDIRPDYIPAIVLASAVLLAVATLACFVPARRASRIDPMAALQYE